MMMKLKVQDQNQEEDIREAFKVFDNVSPLPLKLHKVQIHNIVLTGISGWKWIY